VKIARYSHAMYSTDAQPQLLPGISGSVWKIVSRVIIWVLIAASIPPLIVTVAHLGHGTIFPWFYPAFAATGLTYVAIIAAGARSRKETAAGYTTLWRAHPTLPQLDRATGAVIREAGQPYVKKTDWKSGNSSNAQSFSSHILRPTLWRRLLPALPGWIAIAILILAAGLFGRIAQGLGQAVGISISVGLLAIVIIANGIAVLLARIRLQRMREIVPDDFVFLFGSSKQLRTQAATMGWQGGVAGSVKARAVSANRDGLTFWQDQPFLRAASLPWSRILSIQEDRVPNGNSWLPAVLISYKDEAGDIQALSLANANADLAPLRSMPEVRWIASKLSRLRTGAAEGSA
jgi:hypothetical protein